MRKVYDALSATRRVADELRTVLLYLESLQKTPPQEEEQLDYEDDGEGDIRSDVQEGSNVTRTIPIETTGAVSRLHHTVPEARLTFA